MTKREIIICQDLADLSRRAAEQFITLAEQAGQKTGRFTVVLSGGSTPKGLYSLLATSAYQARIRWSNIHLFFGDERCVPPDHPDSNYRMVRESLLAHIGLEPEHIHPMAGEKEPQLAATEYERMLKAFFALRDGEFPRFDLMLLGLGDDGHTASLFPASEALEEKKRFVLAPFVEKLKSHRLTLTLPVINQSAAIFFLVAGERKATILRRLLEKKSAAEKLPAQKIEPQNGRLVWFVDRQAAASLAKLPASS